MAEWLKVYGETEGPLGFPMRDEDAIRLDETIKAIGGEPDYQRMVVDKAMSEVVADGERADVSWICTEAVDRHKEVVLINGFDDRQYQSNPIVTLNHDYGKHPVGRSLWRKRIRNQHYRGIKAKTIYPTKPEKFEGDCWTPDVAFQLIQSGLMVGKSIGFLTVKAHAPTKEEIAVNPTWAAVNRVIDQWILLEYCCCWLPVNPETITEAVSKSADLSNPLKWLGVEVPTQKAEPTPEPPAPEPIIPFTTVEEIERLIQKQLTGINTDTIIQNCLKDALDKARGRI